MELILCAPFIPFRFQFLARPIAVEPLRAVGLWPSTHPFNCVRKHSCLHLVSSALLISTKSPGVIFAEMGFPLGERAGAKALTGPAKRGLQQTCFFRANLSQRAAKQKHKSHLFMIDFKPHMPCKPCCEPHFQVLFEFVQSLGMSH